MTYEPEPTRWTSSPEEAPELLRGAFVAGRNEGPSKAQMQALALRIAVVSAGGAVALGTAKAAAGSEMAASAASWSLGKLAGVLIVAGSLATGAVIWNRAPQTATHPLSAQTPVELEVAPAPVAAPTNAPTGLGQNLGPATAAPEPAGTPVVTSLEPSVQPSVESAAQLAPVTAPSLAQGSQEPTAGRRGAWLKVQRASPARTVGRAAEREPEQRVEPAPEAAGGPITELGLLQRAQQALRSRPREAFQLTEQHRQLFPDGEFALERDALAIQALIRSGNVAMARDLAESFLKAHPDSPHAHRFREAMGIH